MEIERKWMVSGWPPVGGDVLPLIGTEYQEQGYVHAQAPIVRVRLEARSDEACVSAEFDGSAPLAYDENAPSASGEDASGKSRGAVPAMTDEDMSSKSGRSVTQAVKDSISEDHSHHILCFKSAGFLSREEIEIEVSKEDFERLSGLIGQPLIRKVRRIYQLPEGLELEVNLVDEGLPTEFMYAEVEFANEEQARAWDPAQCGLGEYLVDDVTEKPGQSMSAFWERTRVQM